jgi:hypothetical protein
MTLAVSEMSCAVREALPGCAGDVGLYGGRRRRRRLVRRLRGRAAGGGLAHGAAEDVADRRGLLGGDAAARRPSPAGRPERPQRAG